jgi:hypothetical protein
LARDTRLEPQLNLLLLLLPLLLLLVVVVADWRLAVGMVLMLRWALVVTCGTLNSSVVVVLINGCWQYISLSISDISRIVKKI